MLSVSEIQAMAAADVVACLPDLTQTKMDEDKAKVRAKGARQEKRAREARSGGANDGRGQR